MKTQKTHDSTKMVLGMDEKTWVAFSSVIAAIFLTGIKLVVGVWSNSLGVLSEALHSALDLVAATITLFAVRSSAKPADIDHQYGHGKVESFSALIETLLLLLTVVWVIYEAARRIILSELHVDTSPIAFGVLLISIIVDYSRSRALNKAAKKYDSQALKADALHFSTDILSSRVVFIGLTFTHLGFPLGDPLGAIGVAIIVIILTIKLGRETIDSLLDRAPTGYQDNICAALEQVEDVLSCGRVRIRKSGPMTFVDAEINANPRVSLDEAHQIGNQVRFAIEEAVGPADIMIHMHPESETYTLWIDDIRQESEYFEWIQGIHTIHAFELDEQVYIGLHLEVIPESSLEEIHQLVTLFEDHLKQTFPNIKELVTHIEPFRELKEHKIDISQLKQRINLLIQKTEILQNCHDITFVPWATGGYHLTFHCDAKQNRTIKEIHKATTILEAEIRDELPIFTQVVIHVEPIFAP